MDELVARLRAAGCVFAEDEAAVLREAAAAGGDLERMLRQREEGRPLEYIVGWADFAGTRVPIEPGVFVPRPRSELLVSVAAAMVSRGDLVLDLCCGSGAVGAAIVSRVPVRLVATDIDPRAVGSARKTLAGLDAEIVEGDLFAGVPAAYREAFSAIVVVAPYVPTDAIEFLPHEARDFEPRATLDGGADGLDVLRRIVAEVPAWLAPEGVFATEVGDDQTDALCAVMRSASLEPSVVEDDDAFVVLARRR